MAHEGTPDEVAENFLKHGLEQLSRVLLKGSKNEEKDCQEALHCFDNGIEAQPASMETLFDLLMGRAKLNILRAQFGHCKNDCLNALKIKNDEQAWFVLSRSRFFVEQFEECDKYLK